MMRNWWKLSVLLLVSVAAKAELTSQMEIEERLEVRISKVVHAYDPYASVRVSVDFKKLSAPLPGTAIDLTNFQGNSDLGGVRIDDIQAVRITVSSSKFPLPAWIKTSIDAELKIPGLRKSVDYKQMPEAMRKDLEMNLGDKERISVVAEDLFKKSTSFAEGLMVSLTMKLMMGLILLVGLSLVAGGFMVHFLNKRRMRDFGTMLEAKLVPALQGINTGGGGGGRMTSTIKLEGGNTMGGGAGGSAGATDVEGLPAIALESLFSDCYWCAKDGYAAWLWSSMTPNQRLALFQSTNIEAEYLKFIQGLKPERAADHFDPVYLEPLKIHGLSQDDLAKLVRSNKAMWHFISPMRQSTLPLTIQERLACVSEIVTANSKLPMIPEKRSPKRSLTGTRRIGELSAEDEVTILRNPDLIPDTMRGSLASLVWVALLPVETRTRLLNDFSAEELASAWTATPEILDRLREAIPEKKQKMLDSYLASVKPSKASETYRTLVREALAATAADAGRLAA